MTFILTLLLLAQVGEPAEPPAPESPASVEAAKSAADEFFLGMSRDELINKGTDLALGAALVLVLMAAAWILSGWAASVVRAALVRVRFDETLTKFLAKLVRWLILLLVAIVCLGSLGVATTSFAAVIGAAGLAIGLAFQGTLSNFAAGGMLLIFRPYKVGDVVNIAGNLGKVHEIELFTTSLDTFDNRRIIIPNSEIYGAVIENITFHPVRRADVDVGTSYSADLDQTRAVLEAAVASVPQVVGDPEPAVILTELGGSSINWSVRGWTRGDDFAAAKQGIIRAVKIALDEAGIEIPYPQMDVHVDPPTSSAAS
ncbi:mechanosensitive ion channel [Pirellulales bacterium]|nr:mechanosensitive ion channel [Pirellulales bacterium]